jgi:hypothetical protein
MYSRVPERLLVSMSIGVGSFVLFVSIFNWYTSSSHETDYQRGKPLPRGLVNGSLPPGYPKALYGENVLFVTKSIWP